MDTGCKEINSITYGPYYLVSIFPELSQYGLYWPLLVKELMHTLSS